MSRWSQRRPRTRMTAARWCWAWMTWTRLRDHIARHWNPPTGLHAARAVRGILARLARSQIRNSRRHAVPQPGRARASAAKRFREEPGRWRACALARLLPFMAVQGSWPSSGAGWRSHWHLMTQYAPIRLRRFSTIANPLTWVAQLAANSHSHMVAN